MYKRIPGNLNLCIDNRLNILDSLKQPVSLTEDYEGFVEVELFGKMVKVSKIWLTNMAFLEAGWIKNLSQVYDRIKFYPIRGERLSIKHGLIMSFTEPIYYKPGYRYIPNYSRYAIDTNGNIIDTLTNLQVEQIRYDNDYTCVNIYSPNYCRNRYTRVHRLVALAWIPNDDFLTRPYVNHLDGCKSNNILSNLEWCSHSENSIHAIRTGLNVCNIKMKTRDVVTGEVAVHFSLNDMAKSIGIGETLGNNLLTKLPGYLHNKRYEIKRFDDNTPWYYENKDVVFGEYGKNMYTIDVFNKVDGITKRFSTTLSFYKEYGIHIKSRTIDTAIEFLKTKRPELQVTYKRNAISGPYRVIDLVDNKTHIFSSILESAKFIGRTRTELQFDLFRLFKFIYNRRWIVVPGTSDFDKSEYKDKPAPFDKVAVLNVDTNVELVFSSIKQTCRQLNLYPKTVRSVINTGKTYKGYIFRTVES